MKRAVLMAAILSLAAPIAFATPSSGATVPTVKGPSTTPYYADARITGTTPDSHSAVEFLVRDRPGAKWRVAHTLRSDSSGRWSTSLSMRHDWSYYARVGTARSAVGITRVVSARCTVGGAVFANPLSEGPPAAASGPGDAISALTATRNGVWAGYAYSPFPPTLAALRWHHGQSGATVLARFRLRGSGAFEPSQHGSVDIAGVSPTGTVVAAVQTKLSSNSNGRIDHEGFAWRHGRTYRLQRSPKWHTVHPVAVTSTGAIVGWVRTGVTGHPRYAVVRWATASSPFTVVLGASTRQYQHITVDDRGDITFPVDGATYVRTYTGQVRRIVGREPANSLGSGQVPGGNRFYGGGDLGRQYVWDMTTAPVSGWIRPTAPIAGQSLSVIAAGPRGGVVFNPFGYNKRFVGYLRTRSGAIVRLPNLASTSLFTSGAAIDTAGNAAVSLRKDGLAHFVRCH